jgi:type III secretory pathway lipoprotein EscJ
MRKKSIGELYMHRLVLFIILLVLLTGCKETILHKLDESQANQIKVTLSRNGIKADKIFDGSYWNVTVPKNEALHALTLLDNSRILRNDSRRSLERSKSLIPSREERTHFIERQLATSLEHTLERLPGVLEARVHLYLHATDTFPISLPNENFTASVLVIVDKSQSSRLDLITDQEIQKLVSGASGVQASSISVVITESTVVDKTLNASISEIQTQQTLNVFSVNRDMLNQLISIVGLAILLFVLIILKSRSKATSKEEVKSDSNQLNSEPKRNNQNIADINVSMNGYHENMEVY